jgi:hypothetical protein
MFIPSGLGYYSWNELFLLIHHLVLNYMHLRADQDNDVYLPHQEDIDGRLCWIFSNW